MTVSDGIPEPPGDHDAARQAIDGDADTPDPPRYVWLRRGAVLGLLLISLVSFMRWYWGHHAEAQVAALIAAAHARGERAVPDDFVKTKPIPTENNAADFYLKAISVQVHTPWEQTTSWQSTGLTDADAVELGEIAQKNAAAREFVRQARHCSGIDWHLGAPSLIGLVPAFNQVRRLVNMLGDTAVAEHLAGNDAEAVELLKDELALGKNFDADAYSVIMHLVSLGLQAKAHADALLLAPTLFLQENRDARPNVAKLPISKETGGLPSWISDLRTLPRQSSSVHPASTEQLKELISELLSNPDSDDNARRAMKGEAAMLLDLKTPGIFVKVGGSPLPIVKALWPAIRQAEAAAAVQVDVTARALIQVNLPAATRCYSADSPPYSPLAAFPSIDLSSRFLPLFSTFSHFVQSHFMCTADGRAAAILLAARGYQSEHDQQLPRMLSDLVPRYLPALPADPMRGDGQTFGYRADGAAPLIYSVGLDGKDDGGSSVPLQKWNTSEWRLRDRIYPIDPELRDEPVSSP